MPEVTPSKNPISVLETLPMEVVDGSVTLPVNVGDAVLALAARLELNPDTCDCATVMASEPPFACVAACLVVMETASQLVPFHINCLSLYVTV
jgi:hypothetical protein